MCGSFIFYVFNHNHFKYIEQHIRMMVTRMVQSSEGIFTSLHIQFGCPVMAVKSWWKRSANADLCKTAQLKKFTCYNPTTSIFLFLMLCTIHHQTGAFSILCLLFSSCCSQIKKNSLLLN